METIYAVFATHENRNQLLGHAVGELADIKAVYDDRKAYGLVIEPITVNYVPAGFASKKSKLVEKKKQLQAQMLELESELRKFGG